MCLILIWIKEYIIVESLKICIDLLSDISHFQIPKSKNVSSFGDIFRNVHNFGIAYAVRQNMFPH